VTSLEGDDFAVYDADSLDQLWGARGLASHTIDINTRTLIGVDEHGDVTEYELATGAVVRSGHIVLPSGVAEFGMTATDDLIAVYLHSGDWDSEILAFDRRTFAPRPGAEPQFPEATRFECGSVVCETGSDHGQVVVLDPLTGQVLWQPKYGAGLMSTPAGLFAFPQLDSSNPMPIELLDPRTGRKLASLEGWQPIPVEGRFRAAPVVMRQKHVAGRDLSLPVCGLGAGLRHRRPPPARHRDQFRALADVT
jgi:hypothetical protein